jgi:hypothetical protein
MKVSVQVIVYPENDVDDRPVAREVFALDRDRLAPDTLGLQLAEAQDPVGRAGQTSREHRYGVQFPERGWQGWAGDLNSSHLLRTGAIETRRRCLLAA